MEAYAHHLRSTIIRLRRRPIRRFKAWLHTISSHFAFSRSLVAYCVLLAVLTASLYLSELYLSEQLAWATEIKTRFDALLIWKPLDERLLYANGIAAGCVAVAAPVFYIARLARLHSTHRPQIRVLKEFAGTDPDRLIRQSQDDRADQETLHEAALAEASDDDTWFAVLGLPPTATIEEVKEAYKALIKQNHPDRVHGMSPAFRELAEAETRKLNSAYEEALNLLRPLEFEQRASSG
ncbi:MAG TPA: J domain-containing protein [Xanthobacteraceae bacterium]|nr:J domain-containing protein [Xanthobacteraceae bacterium]